MTGKVILAMKRSASMSMVNLPPLASIKPVSYTHLETKKSIVKKECNVSRAPHGARGLKQDFLRSYPPNSGVAPRMGRVD